MRDIVVIGAGGHSKVVISALRASGHEPIAVLDDDSTKTNSQILGVPVRGALNLLREIEAAGVVMAIGNNRTRRRIASKLDAAWITVIHPTAYVDPTARVGPGTVVFAGAIIQADTVIGAHAIINTGASVDHDCIIGDFTHLAPGVRLAGDVRVGEGTLMGIGSVAIPGVRIGNWATIGAGAAAIANIASDTVASGLPARPHVRNRAQGESR
jgi:sugar O-acyltransferase (sialic acid O-acetyltransferase NeuD family)